MNNEQLPAFPTNTGPGFDEGWCAPAEGLSKLEAFTKAAMQGLCANPNITTVYPNVDKVMFAQNLEHAAVHIARATLSTLQDEQK